MAQLILETLIIGLITGVIGFIISTLLMVLFSKGFSFKEYTFWFQVFIGYFITGAIIHLSFEWAGLNQKFCCQKDRFNCV